MSVKLIAASDRHHDGARSSRLCRLVQNVSRYQVLIAILLALICLGSQVWQPFMLGFEHDDWYLFVRPHMLRDFSNRHADRPGYFLLSWIILHFWDGNASEFQSIKVIINLATAGSVFWFTLSLQRLFRVSNALLAVAAATLWLIAPWGLGYTVWATAAFTNVALLCFCISMVQFLSWVERGNWLSMVLAALLWASSIETYQSTWFAFVPVTFAVLLAIHDRKPQRNRALILSLVFFALQLGSLGHTVMTSPKSQSSAVLGLMVNNFLEIARIHIRQLGWFIFTWVLVVVFVFARVALRSAEARPLDSRRIIAGLAMAIIGSCGSAALYAAAGYILGESGETSKTTVMLTFWTAVGFSICLTVNAEERLKAIVGTATSLSVIVVCLINYPSRARPWIAAWNLQREVLETIKGQTFPRRLQLGDVILSDLPTDVASVPVFGAPWVSSSAALVAWENVIPDLAHRSGLPVQIVAVSDAAIEWEAGKLTIVPRYAPTNVMPVERIWLWRWKTGEAILIKSPGALVPRGFDIVFDQLANTR
jgi:hypothetical protein